MLLKIWAFRIFNLFFIMSFAFIKNVKKKSGVKMCYFKEYQKTQP